MVLCGDITEQANRDNMLISNIVFTDKSLFFLDGSHNPFLSLGYSRKNIHSSLYSQNVLLIKIKMRINSDDAL